MKKLIISTVILLAAVCGFAQRGPGQQAQQQPPTPEQAAQRQANSLSERLSLSEDQRSKAYSIFLDRAKKDQAERTARLKEMQKQRQQDSIQRKQESDKIGQLLTADQKKRFEEFRQPNNRPGGQANRPGMGGGRQGEQGMRRGMPPNQQLGGQGNQGQRLQPGPGRRPGGNNSGPGFEARPNRQQGFQQGGPGQNFRPQPGRGGNQQPRLQNRQQGFRPLPNRPQQTPAGPAQPLEKK